MSTVRQITRGDARPTAQPSRRRISSGSLRTIILIAAAGLLTGYQIFDPTKRVIEAIIGLILVLVLWSISGFYAVLFVIISYPFPFAISVGNSDFIFILIIFAISLVRTRGGSFSFRSSKMLDIPVFLIVLSLFLSFYNVDYAGGEFRLNMTATFPILTAVILFYLCISYIDDEERMKKALNAVIISAALVSGFTMLELVFPGKVLIPNWLYSQHRAMLVVKGLRMMGPFHDYELLSEFFALNIPLIFLCLVRSKRLLTKAAYALLLLTSLFLMFSTITRGGVIILSAGFIYMAAISRRDFNFTRLVSYAIVLVLLMVMIDAFMARYTTSGSTFARIFASTFKRGVIPENRYDIWVRGIKLGMETPFVGHGPAWDYSKGIVYRLIPHNIFMYVFDLTGLFGLAAFVFFLYRLLRMSVVSIGASLVSSPFPHALMKTLHVCLLMFVLDQLKVEYLRNNIYTYFIWLLFGLMAATYNILERGASRGAPAPAPR
jgi:hypothetical protein